MEQSPQNIYLNPYQTVPALIVADPYGGKMENSRKVIITGGSRGIGAALVEKFAESGDNVVFLYRSNDSKADEISQKTNSLHIKCDISDYNIAKEKIKEAVELLGGCDILINNAGISHIGLLQDMTDEEIERVLSVNLTSAVRLTRDVIPSMISAHSGCIINIGSVWGEHGASCEAVYSASKAGLRGFTKALAKELGPSGIRVNLVEPGVIATDMNASLPEDVIDELKEETPLCRLGTPGDIANAVFFLASDNASFITGAVLPVNGGFPA